MDFYYKKFLHDLIIGRRNILCLKQLLHMEHLICFIIGHLKPLQRLKELGDEFNAQRADLVSNIKCVDRVISQDSCALKLHIITT